MEKAHTEHRDRLVALGVVSVLLMLVYGPAAQLFVAADRFLYDQLSAHLPASGLSDGVVVSIDDSGGDAARIADDYGRLLAVARSGGAARIVLPNPPPFDDPGSMPRWTETLGDGPPVRSEERRVGKEC